jgi:hypothetical protein
VLFFQFPAVNQNEDIAFGILRHGGEDVGLTGTARGDYQYALTAPECLAGRFVEGLLVIAQLNIVHLLCAEQAEHPRNINVPHHFSFKNSGFHHIPLIYQLF